MDTSGASSIFDTISMQSALRENSANTALSSGISFMEKKKYSQAVQSFKQAAALKPDLAEAYAFQGDALLRLGKRKKLKLPTNWRLKLIRPWILSIPPWQTCRLIWGKRRMQLRRLRKLSR